MKQVDKLTLSREMQRRADFEKLRYFVPNGSQEEFINKVGDGKYFIGLFIGGNGVGKTALMTNVLANIFWGPQNEWFDKPIFRKFPFPKRARIGSEPKNMQEIGSIDQEINTWWPKGRFSGSKDGKLYISRYNIDNGWLLDKMSFDQEKKEWESATLGLAVFDEPPPEAIWSATVARMRKGGLILFFLTPLGNSAWIQDKLIDTHSEKTFTVFADIEKNCKTHGVRGQLEHAHIEAILDELKRTNIDEYEARANGKFVHMSNVILGSSFSREHHIVSDELKAPHGSQWGMVVDPASGKPWAIAYYWVDARGQIVFDREYPLEDFTQVKESNNTIFNYRDIIKIMDEGNEIHWRIIDRRYANQKDGYGNTLKGDLYDKFNIDFMNSYDCGEEIDTGIQKMKDYLAFNRNLPIDTVNFPKLLVKERCKNIIKSLERWSRDPITLQPDRRSPYKDHFDLVRYVVMSEPKPEYYRSSEYIHRQIYAPGRR